MKVVKSGISPTQTTLRCEDVDLENNEFCAGTPNKEDAEIALGELKNLGRSMRE
jgi:hypothetical protein